MVYFVQHSNAVTNQSHGKILLCKYMRTCIVETRILRSLKVICIYHYKLVDSPLRKDDLSRDHGAMTSAGRSNPNENNPNMFCICSMRYSSMPLDCCWRRPPPPSPALLSLAATAANESSLRLAAYSNAFLSRPLKRHVPGPSAEVHRNTPNDLSGPESLWPDDNRTVTMIPRRHHLMADIFDVKIRLI